ncbi:ABC transporter substrate-binding protein [Thiorhodococcus drewsii]|nr:transporter substrate-binding domain-containing protein [Thiorhodococcus drewsii]
MADLTALLVLLLSLTPLRGMARDAPSADPLTRVSVQLTWKHQFQFAGFYAAIAQGFYRDRGLSVELREYTQGLDMLDEVRSGRATYGIANGSVIDWRLAGEPVVLLANYFRKAPLVVLGQPGIRTLNDLRGKRLMAEETELRSPLLSAALRETGLVPGTNLTIRPHAFDAGPFIRGEVEATTAFFTNEPFELERKGIPFQTIELNGYLPGLGDDYLFTSETQASTHPERTRAFVQASNAGWRYALDHPDEIVELILDRHSRRKSHEALAYEADKTRDLILPFSAPIGALLPRRIEMVASALLDAGHPGSLANLQGFLFDEGTPIRAPHRPPNPLDYSGAERAWIKAHPRVSLRVDADDAPYSFVDGTGTLDGILVDLVRAMCEDAGLEPNLTPGSHAKMDQESREPGIQGYLNFDYHDAGASGSFLGIESPIPPMYALYTRRPNEFSSDGLRNLKGKRILLAKGMDPTEQGFSAADNQYQWVETPEEAFERLLSDRADAYFANFAHVQWHLHRHFITDLTPLYFSSGYPDPMLAVFKEYPELHAILKKAYGHVSNRLPSLLARWQLEQAGASRPALTKEQRRWLSAHPVIRYAVNPNWAPIESLDRDGHPTGMAHEYIQRIQDLLGVRFEPVAVASWTDLRERFEHGEIDVLPGIVETQSRRAHYRFTAPYLTFPVAIFAPAGAPFLGSLDALADKKVAVVGDYATHEWLRQDHPEIVTVPVATTAAALKEVAEGRVDAFVDNLVTTSHAIGQDGLLEIRMAGTTPYELSVGMAVRKDWPVLVDILEHAIAALPKIERDGIYNRWVQALPPAVVDYGLLWKALAVCALVLAVTLYWNRRLRREMRMRRHAEQTLADSERRYREMVESAGTSDFHFYSITPSGLIGYVTPGSFKLFGNASETILGRHWREVVTWPEPAIELFESAIGICLNGQVPEPVTLEFSRNGVRQQLISHPRPVKDERGRTVRIEGIAVNLTARLQLEEQLFAAITAAREANQAKSIFLATISHEIRTPMNAIVGMIHLCLDSPLNAEQHGYLQAARRASESLMQLLNGILDESKAEAGRLTLEARPFALRELIENLNALVARRGQGSELAFRYQIDPEIPPRLLGDPLRLGQILTNLIDNAVKFTERGEILLSVRMPEIQERRLRLEFTVRDTGIGIDEAEIGNLFEPFRQADSSITRRYGGSGLGLAISRHLVELMGGTIDVTSRIDEGSTFRFDIWLDRPAAPNEALTAHRVPKDVPRVPEEETERQGGPDTALPMTPKTLAATASGGSSPETVLTELRERAERRDPTTEDVLAEHRQVLADALSPESFRMLSDQIENYRFGEAAVTLDDLVRTFEISK